MLTRNRSATIPKLMRHLPCDARGYPIPWIVYRDASNQAYFAINDSSRILMAKQCRLCSICGQALQTQSADNSLWLIGGPLSALHENGSYNDPAVHRLCGIYALKTCPYLALPSWGRTATVGQKIADRIPEDKLAPGTVGFHDPTSSEAHLAQKPPLFLFVKTSSYDFDMRTTHIQPQKPYLGIEYWLDGVSISGQRAFSLLQKWFNDLPPDLSAGVRLPT